MIRPFVFVRERDLLLFAEQVSDWLAKSHDFRKMDHSPVKSHVSVCDLFLLVTRFCL